MSEQSPLSEENRRPNRRPRRWLALLFIVPLGFLVASGILAWNLIHPYAPPQGQQCGTISHGLLSDRKAYAHKASLVALNCFWRAYQQCRPATIVQGFSATDAGGTETITIVRNNGACSIFDSRDVFANTEQKQYSFTCALLQRVGDDLRATKCSDPEDDPLDISSVTTRPQHCGSIAPNTPYTSTMRSESCFRYLFDECYAGDLSAVTQQQGTLVSRTFSINDQCKIAYQRGSYSAICAGLQADQKGMHFTACGRDGDVLVPLPPAPATSQA